MLLVLLDGIKEIVKEIVVGLLAIAALLIVLTLALFLVIGLPIIIHHKDKRHLESIKKAIDSTPPPTIGDPGSLQKYMNDKSGAEEDAYDKSRMNWSQLAKQATSLTASAFATGGTSLLTSAALASKNRGEGEE